MMVKNRGLPESLGGHYNQYLVELIQRATTDWDPSCPVFPQWPAAMDSVDTGERCGLARSLWGGESDGEVWNGPDDAALRADLGKGDDVNGRTPLSHLTLSSKLYANMMGEKMPETRVHTWQERRKFRDELPQNYWQQGDLMGRLQQYQRVNFDSWAGKWNSFCDKIHKGAVKWVPIYRKTAKQLEEYYADHKRKANIDLTLFPIRKTADTLRWDLQEPVDGATFEGSVAQIESPPLTFRKATAPEGGASGAGAGVGSSGSGVAAAIHAASAAGSIVQEGGGGGARGGGGSGSGTPIVIRPAPTTAGLAVRGQGTSGAGSSGGRGHGKRSGMQPRRPQICVECGHCSGAAAFIADHPRKAGGCSVSADRRRPDSDRTGRMTAGGKRRQFSPCQCRECKPKFDAYGTALAASNA